MNSKRRTGLLSCIILLGLSLLGACADSSTPTPVLPGLTPKPSVTATATSTITVASTEVPATQSPTATSIVTATPAVTVGLNSVAPLTTAPIPTATATPTPVAGPPTPSITPSTFVPLQPVRRTGGTLTVGALAEDIAKINYSPYSPDLSDTSRHFQRLVWNARLLYQDPVKLDWRPLAAQNLPVVDNDGKRYTFALRDDLKWSDGSLITSADYIYAFTNALQSRFPRANDLQHIKTLEGPDLHTLVFTFDDVYATAYETINLLEPLPVKVWSRYSFDSPDKNPEITRPTITSGPFMLASTGLNFQSNPSFYLGRPNFNAITVKTFKSASELQDNLKAGLLGWVYYNLPNNLYPQLGNITALNLYRWYPADSARRYIGYNLKTAFLQNKAVRQALNHSLDVRSMIATVENGLAQEQQTFLPPVNEYALRGPLTPMFSILQAHDLLKTAGFTQEDTDNNLVDATGKPVPVLEVIYPDGIPELNTSAIYLQQQYQQLGLRVHLNNLDEATYQKRRSTGQYDIDIATVQITGAFDPDDYKAQFITKGTLNFSGYSNPDVDNLFNQGLHLSVDQKTQRRVIYDQLQRTIADDAPAFFLYTLQAYTAMSSQIDPSSGGIINLPRWQLAWDAFPAYLNWYFRDAA
ncbi:MAG TPA: ABC transporter substrate-binding protein [Chloroflexia bacterium]|nr:ABC transporter substrate-binding protein [Chloroflexia bacterium]